jgi:glycerol-3-phosphate dehydrogenase
MTRGGRPELLSESSVICHARRGVAGLVTIVGAKYTMARISAAAAVSAVSAELGRRKGPCRTGTLPLPHAGIADVEGRLTETLRSLDTTFEKDILDHLAGWYGTEAPAVVRYAVEHGAAERLTPDLPFLAVEFRYAAEHASAVQLGDAVLRRTPLGSSGHPGRPALERAAAEMAGPLGWSESEQAAQVAAVERVYPSFVATGLRKP